MARAVVPFEAGSGEGFRGMGRAAALALENFDNGIARVEATVRVGIKRSLERLEQQIGEADARRALADRMANELVARKAELEQERRRIMRQAGPPHYRPSIVKGGLYLALSLIALAADFSILGQAISRLLNYKWYLDEPPHLSFPQLLLSEPWKAVQDFPDLFALTVGILLLGMFLKVWRDYFAWAIDGDPRASVMLWWQFRIASGVAVLSVVVVAAMALARFQVPLGNYDTRTARAISVVLGFSLPYVSAGLFVLGSDLVSSGFAVFRLGAHAAWLNVVYKRSVGSMARIAIQRQSLQSERDTYTGAQQIEDSLQVARSEFTVGYNEGFAGLLMPAAGESLYRHLQPLALRRLLERRLR